MLRQIWTAAFLTLAVLGNLAAANAQTSKVAASKRQITNSIGMKLTSIPAGEFMMGSGESAEATAAFFNKTYGEYVLEASSFTDEHPQHRVRITKPFYLGTYHVTRGQFRQFVNDTGYKTDAEKDEKPGAYGWNPDTKGIELNEKYSWRNAGFEQTDEHPVVNVSWNDTVAFCKWLSKRKARPIGCPRRRSGNMPAVRGRPRGTTAATILRRWPKSPTLRTPRSRRRSRMRNTRSKPAMAMCLRRRWVHSSPMLTGSTTCTEIPGSGAQDWYGAEYYAASPADDPTGPDSGNVRVLRGGSWLNRPSSTRCADAAGSRRTSGSAARASALPGTCCPTVSNVYQWRRDCGASAMLIFIAETSGDENWPAASPAGGSIPHARISYQRTITTNLNFLARGALYLFAGRC